VVSSISAAYAAAFAAASGASAAQTAAYLHAGKLIAAACRRLHWLLLPDFRYSTRAALTRQQRLCCYALACLGNIFGATALRSTAASWRERVACGGPGMREPRAW